MATGIDRPDVLATLASMRPDAEAVERTWSQNRRQAALRHALTAPAPTRQSPGSRPASRSASRWVGVGLAIAAVGAAVLLLVPASLGSRPTQAVPVATPTPASAEPTEPAVTTEPSPTPEAGAREELAAVTVGTAGWKTFSSPEYPITFAYPPDWKVSFPKHTPTTAKGTELTDAGIVEGCSIGGCTLYVSPPGKASEGPGSVVLHRNGFDGQTGDRVWHGATVLAPVPDLSLWTAADSNSPSAAVIVTRSANGFCVKNCPAEDEFGPPYEYMLSTPGLAANVAVGSADPMAGQPESSFSFGTNWGPEGEEGKIVATILASSRQNPEFDPTQPEKDRSGRYKFWTMESMAAPAVDTEVNGWEALEVPEGNISLRIPPKWTVDDHDGIILVWAPSGYAVAVLMSGEAQLDCRAASRWTPSERLGSLSGRVGTDADGVSRPVEIWWQDATWHPVEIWLAVARPAAGGGVCTQNSIDYGGKLPVSVGSADNLENPTAAELVQAAAMLASLERLD